MRVVGAGVGRTGTTSLKLALERLLGGRCHHMLEVIPNPDQQTMWAAAVHGESVDWHEILAGYNAIVDWPGAAFWRDLTGVYPDALVLLSVRDPERWYESASKTIFASFKRIEPGDQGWGGAMLQMMRDRFDDRFDDPAAMMAAFVRHNDEVRNAVPAARLLEWQAGDGWEPLCERLGVGVPTEPFPRANTTDDFRAMIGLPPIPSKS
jgi:hypothetical protein